MRKAVFLLACFMFSISGFAMLPPFYQSSAEIKRILNDNRLTEKLGSGQLILDIKKVDGGWLITAPKYELKVDVNYLPAHMPGPAQFDLKFKIL